MGALYLLPPQAVASIYMYYTWLWTSDVMASSSQALGNPMLTINGLSEYFRSIPNIISRLEAWGALLLVLAVLGVASGSSFHFTPA